MTSETVVTGLPECHTSANGQHHWRGLPYIHFDVGWQWDSGISHRLSKLQRDRTSPNEWRWCPACDRLEYIGPPPPHASTDADALVTQAPETA